MAAPLKPVTTKRQVTVKPYVSKSGGVVETHQMRHIVADKSPKTVNSYEHSMEEPIIIIGEEEPQSNRKTLQVRSTTKPVPLARFDEDSNIIHTSGVYSVTDNKGEHGFFKPETEECWGEGHVHPSQLGHDPHASEDALFRLSVKNDRLGQREVLASEISSIFSMNSIPKTEWAHMQHGDKDYGEGSIQTDARSMLEKQGYQGGKSVEEFIGLHREPSGAIRTDAYQHVKSALSNGGMDIAFFDAIIGNTDRHFANLFIGHNTTNGESKFVGIDHGLSFPDSPGQLDMFDFKTTSNGLWNSAIVFGKGVSCTEGFKAALQHPDTPKKLQNALSSSSLTHEERAGVMTRFEVVKQQHRMSGNLTGHDLEAVKGTLLK